MAMKINELMIGDWVYNKHHKKNIKIEPYDFFVHGHGNNGTFAVSSTVVSGRDLVPIPLTEEILVKNGFVYCEAEETCATNAYHHWQLDGEYLALDDFQYWRKEKKDDLPRFSIAGIDVNYVHQLQHLLRLCGIEKELTI